MLFPGKTTKLLVQQYQEQYFHVRKISQLELSRNSKNMCFVLWKISCTILPFFLRLAAL